MTLDASIEELAIELYKHKCILVGEFTLTSGLKSPYYIDLRIAPSYPELFNKIIRVYNNLLAKLEADYIVGIALGGIPIASVLAYINSKPLLYVRKEAKHHGTGRVVEGVVEKMGNTVIVDDVATTGSSLISAVNAVRDLGLEVRYAVVLVDREQGAISKLKDVNVELKFAMKVSELFQILYNYNVIDSETYDKIMRYVRGDLYER